MPSTNSASQFAPSLASHFPLRKLISPRHWKLWAVGFFGFALGALIVAGGVFNAEYADRFGPGFVRLFNFETGKAVDFYLGGMLLLSGQLALLIWSVRSRSLRDFAGQYRTWIWVAGAAFCMSMIVLTDAHLAWSETILWTWQVSFWNDQLLCWLVPLAAVSAVFLLAMLGDMRECRLSLAILWLGVICWLVTAASKFEEFNSAVADVIPNPILLGTLPIALAVFGSLCLFFSLLLHARHVIHKSAEPPKERPASQSTQKRRFRLPLLGLGARKNHDASAGKSQGGHSTAAGGSKTASRRASSTTKSSSSTSAKKTVAKPKKKQSAPKPKSVDLAVELEGETIPLDTPPDPATLKGLSKRERRNLRKQWRDQQRAARAA